MPPSDEEGEHNPAVPAEGTGDSPQGLQRASVMGALRGGKRGLGVLGVSGVLGESQGGSLGQTKLIWGIRTF